MHRDEEEEERNRKIRVKGKYVFSYICNFNGVYREIYEFCTEVIL